ncbi:alcohol dehydrogenase zinc-containing [Colletotrichum asianum]
MLASSTGADTAALADKGISLHNVYGSFETHPILFQGWAVALPNWLSTSDMVVLPHKVIRGLNPQAVNAALDDIGKGGGVRYVVRVHLDDGDDDDGEEARDI